MSVIIIIILLLLGGYFYYDPFKVIYNYNDYSNLRIIPNRDYVSTEMFLKNRQKEQYNSFIFGSSRTLAFKPSLWKKHLDNEAKIYSFDASAESIYGIYKKIKLIDSLNISINNALIIICRDCTFQKTTNHEEHLFVKHSALTGENKYHFQTRFLKSYLSPKFLFRFYPYILTGRYMKWMKGYVEFRKIIFDPKTNEITILDQEIEIKTNPSLYYAKRKALFYNRYGEKHDSTQRIKDLHIKMLAEINKIFIKHNTNYRIVLSPLYEQIKFSDMDYKTLKILFSENLYDYSGKNEFTESIFNYYETAHFRPFIGERIFNLIYKSDSELGLQKF